jgi:hypothetical protein
MDHSHGHDHNHDHGGHGHSHGHGHDRHHDHGAGEYYLNQLLLVFICGVFAVVGILLYQTLTNNNGGMISKLLAPKFQLPVLIGGIGLLAVVLVRGVCLWQSAGERHDHHHGHSHAHHDHHHGHDHKPGEKCDHPDHNHEHCDEPDHVHTEACGHHPPGHDHGDHSAEDHDHGNVYWRVVVLGFPIFLFLMGVPSKGFSARWIAEFLGEEEALRYNKLLVAEDTSKQPLYDFKSLNEMSKNESARQSLTGTRAMLKGQFAPAGEKEFSLVFLSMVCCATDNEPLRARILVQNASQIAPFKQQAYQWVQTSGIISEFVQSSKGDWVAIIQIDDKGYVQATMEGK